MYSECWKQKLTRVAIDWAYSEIGRKMANCLIFCALHTTQKSIVIMVLPRVITHLAHSKAIFHKVVRHCGLRPWSITELAMTWLVLSRFTPHVPVLHPIVPVPVLPHPSYQAIMKKLNKLACLSN